MEWVGGIAFRRLRFKILSSYRESSRRFFAGFGVSCWRVKKKTLRTTRLERARRTFSLPPPAPSGDRAVSKQGGKNFHLGLAIAARLTTHSPTLTSSSQTV